MKKEVLRTDILDEWSKLCFCKMLPFSCFVFKKLWWILIIDKLICVLKVTFIHVFVVKAIILYQIQNKMTIYQNIIIYNSGLFYSKNIRWRQNSRNVTESPHPRNKSSLISSHDASTCCLVCLCKCCFFSLFFFSCKCVRV